jgi:hypothetical protein
MKAIVHWKADGGIAITTPVHADAIVVDVADLPTDTDFRDAFVIQGESVVVDFGRAKIVERARLESLTAPLIEAENAKYLEALQTKDTAKEKAAAEEAQRLRALPDLVDSAKTLDELRALRPLGVSNG